MLSVRRLYFAWLSVFTLVGAAGALQAAGPEQPTPGEIANRLTYLDDNDPYYPSRTFPKLVTPQWVGEEGVEAVVVLAIDDMRDPAKYETFLRPILQRLKAIDGRAPLSIMGNTVDPANPRHAALLQQWLSEGLSLETHTIEHPCPLLADADFAKSRSTYERCVDLFHTIPGNVPVAFRMPCCDSLNTVSPRFFSELFNSRTEQGHFLQIDSSVFNILTSNDPDSPRELVLDADAREKFRKYVPFPSFANTIEDYPYPYVIGRMCWEFPCVTPTDWSAQHLQKPNNPNTVRDLKAALDIVVRKQGVYNLVFHPHGWIENTQIVEIIEHAVRTHGRKVKFLTFKEALQRLNRYLLADNPLRSADGQDNGVRVLDLNHDGFQDVCIGNESARLTRVWEPTGRTWQTTPFPASIIQVDRNGKHHDAGLHFGVIRPDGLALALVSTQATRRAWQFTGMTTGWELDVGLRELLRTDRDNLLTNVLGRDRGGRLRDIDGDGACEYIVSSPAAQAIHHLVPETGKWELLPWTLPEGTHIANIRGRDAGLRFVDLNGDGREDIVFSNEKLYGVWLWDSPETGWKLVHQGVRGEAGTAAEDEIPVISREGTDNGAWFHSRTLWVQNEDTARLPDLVDRRSFNTLLAKAAFVTKPLAPPEALRSLKPRDGYRVEVVASEPLTMDPVAFDWGADGKFWIVEMADYPRGSDGQGAPGGRVRFLEDTDGDGHYDKSTLFLDKVPFPNGVHAWGKGVLITAAPDILYAEDLDGDGKADKRITLYTGFAEGNQQHRVNGLALGLDNWLYCANGDSGGRIRSLMLGAPPAAAVGIGINGRDLKIEPRTGTVEAVTGQTQFGRNRDDWGHWFGNNNSNPMYQFVLQDEYIRRNPHHAAPSPVVNVPVIPGPAPVFPLSRTVTRFNDFDRANRFTSACSTMVYRDDLFPQTSSDSGWVFISEPVHNLVHRELLTVDAQRAGGVAFTSRRTADEERSEFLASTDGWFRPTMIRTGPDGALWIADMYRLVIEHPEWIPLDWQQKLDLRAGEEKGRIYRVVPVGAPPRTVPRLDKLTPLQLVAALDSPSGWQRDKAQELLVGTSHRTSPAAPEVVAALTTLLQSHKRPLSRLHALATLEGLQALTPQALLAGLRDPHSGVRRHAVWCVARAFGTEPPSAEIIEALAMVGQDPDALVRRELAGALGDLPGEAAGHILGRLFVQNQLDAYGLANAFSSLREDNLGWVLEEVLTHGGDSPQVTSVLSAAAAFKNDTATVALLTTIARRSDPKSTASGHYAPWQYAALGDWLDRLDSRGETLPNLQVKASPALKAAIDGLAPLFATAREQVAVKSDAGAAEASLAIRIAAVRCLARGPAATDEDRRLLAGLLAPQNPASIQEAAVAALGRMPAPEVAAVLLGEWKGYSPAIRMVVFDALLRRAEWSAALLIALESGQIRPVDLDAARRQRLLTHGDQAVRSRALKVFAVTTNADRSKVLAQYQAALKLPGDALRGRGVFTRICTQCHRLGGEGFDVGPDLAALTDKSPEALLVAIFDPNRAVEAKFLNYVAETKNGLQYSGLLAAETGNSLTLLGPQAKEQTLLRADLESLTSTAKSTMPEGLEKDISVQEAADLLAFVRATVPLPKRKEFPGNTPRVVTAGANGILELMPATAEIYGPTLVLEEKYKNLGYWTNPEDFAQWSIELPAAGTYSVVFDYACEPQAAGNTLQLLAGDATSEITIPATANWDDYVQKKLGEVILPAGRQRLILKPQGEVRGAVLDLRGLRLERKP